jgi:hypothetical protein
LPIDAIFRENGRETIERFGRVEETTNTRDARRVKDAVVSVMKNGIGVGMSAMK